MAGAGVTADRATNQPGRIALTLACTRTWRAVKQCCFYNNNHVDGWECRRKKTNKAKEKCWREANEKMANCNRQCEWDRGGIITINPAFP